METVATQISTEQILSSVNQLSLPELEKIFDRVLWLQAERKAPHLPDEEAALLTRSLQGLPPDMRARTNLLRAKREDESITDAEYEELTELTLRSEELHAERMEAICKLARLRGLSLPAILDQLGLRFPENG
ncbi:MAG: STAS/SEC14 domain-containing protein [Blastocatellia bacterium]